MKDGSLPGRRFVPLAALVFLFSAAVPALAQGYGGGELAPNTRDDRLSHAERQVEILIAQELADERARLAPDAPRLAGDPDLDAIARIRSEDMAAGAPFSHEDGAGRFVAAEMMQRRFGPRGTWGENILTERGEEDFDPVGFARRAVQGWMESPGHRKNILDGDYNRCGIGVTVAGDSVYATEVFLGPAPSKRAAQKRS